MKLRKYQKEDADIICGWIRDEKSLYQWSSDRLGKFPLSGDDLNKHYQSVLPGGRFIPMTAVDESGRVTGHFFIRYPDEKDDRTVRFGFIIVDPAIRGRGNGREMLKAAIDYARRALNAERIILGVFANNDSARYCYQSVGFRPAGKSAVRHTPMGGWECIEMALTL